MSTDNSHSEEQSALGQESAGHLSRLGTPEGIEFERKRIFDISHGGTLHEEHHQSFHGRQQHDEDTKRNKQPREVNESYQLVSVLVLTWKLGRFREILLTVRSGRGLSTTGTGRLDTPELVNMFACFLKFG